MGELRNERETLSKVQALLLSGDLQHDGSFDLDRPREGQILNMGMTCHAFGCGTVACIGGWAWIIENPGDVRGAAKYVGAMENYDVQAVWDERTGLTELYYPKKAGGYSEIEPAQAAQAIANYLETGDPQWNSVLYPEQSR